MVTGSAAIASLASNDVIFFSVAGTAGAPLPREKVSQNCLTRGGQIQIRIGLDPAGFRSRTA